jgi:CheY-like chemotaxis protein
MSPRDASSAMRALVIDDDEIACELMASLLEGVNWHVHRLPSPIGATKLIIDKRIHVVVADLMMPDITGDKFARLLRGNPRIAKVGIVLISSSSSELDRAGMDSGVDAIVHKSDARNRLVPAVREAYRKRGSL